MAFKNIILGFMHQTALYFIFKDQTIDFKTV